MPAVVELSLDERVKDLTRAANTILERRHEVIALMRDEVGKLADAELYFTDGPLAGMKLIGFSIWARRDKSGRNVTFPSRQYSVNGERRSFALLRPIVDVSADAAVRDLILAGYAKWEAENLPAPVEQAHTEDAYF